MSRLKSEIRFSTDGWRAIISREMTFEHLSYLTAAFARVLKERGNEGHPIVIGYDRRFLSREYAEEAAQVAAGHGVKVFLSDDHCPTPCVSFMIIKERAAGGLMITASNSPAEYNGVKFRAEYGGPAPSEMTDRVLQVADELYDTEETIPFMPLEEALSKRRIEHFDPRPDYAELIMARLEWRSMANAGLEPVIDPMFGAAAGYTDYILNRIGIRPYLIRDTFTPGFQGVQPEPVARNLHALSGRVIAEQAHVGIATDGDGDRVGLVDEYGDYINAQTAMALLCDYLIFDKGYKGNIVKTVACTTMLDKLCALQERRCLEMPVGFEPISRRILQGGILLGCEESGGYAMAGHIPERDGVLMSCLFLEMLARHRRPLSELVARLYEKVGTHAYERYDLRMDMQEARKLVADIRQKPPGKLGEWTVDGTSDKDGIKLLLEDGAWLLMRASGSLPVLRLYAEASSADAVQEILGGAIKEWGLEEYPDSHVA